MNVEALRAQDVSQVQMRNTTDEISQARKKKEDVDQGEVVEKKQVQPEELLKQIKALTEDGLYSVHFETDDRIDGLVVKIVDRENDEIIRQVPAEELLDLRAILDDLRGNIISTEG